MCTCARARVKSWGRVGGSDETETPEGALLGSIFIINPKKQKQTSRTHPEGSSCTGDSISSFLRGKHLKMISQISLRVVKIWHKDTTGSLRGASGQEALCLYFRAVSLVCAPLQTSLLPTLYIISSSLLSVCLTHGPGLHAADRAGLGEVE